MEESKQKIDKSKWGPGPWQTEPDRVEFEHLGLTCLMRRHPRWGNWCGYVAMPPGHPWHGKGHDEVPTYDYGTYSGACSGDICHVPKPGEADNVWWIGFDCGHSGDLSPGMTPPTERSSYETYKDLAYARAECERLATLAKAAQ